MITYNNNYIIGIFFDFRKMLHTHAYIIFLKVSKNHKKTTYSKPNI